MVNVLFQSKCSQAINFSWVNSAAEMCNKYSHHCSANRVKPKVRLCMQCSRIEDEFHVIMQCPMYDDIRSSCLKSIHVLSHEFKELTSEHQFNEIMSNPLYYRIVSRFMYDNHNKRRYMPYVIS